MVLINQDPVKAKPYHGIGRSIYRLLRDAGVIIIRYGIARIQDRVSRKDLLQIIAHHKSAETLYTKVKEHGFFLCVMVSVNRLYIALKVKLVQYGVVTRWVVNGIVPHFYTYNQL